MTKRNVAESVKQRLLNQRKATGRPYDELLRYFGMERFLYRLGQTRHVNDFVLKGAMMLRVLDAGMARPTADLDLMGKQLWSADQIAAMVEDCFAVPVEDGLTFDRNSLRTDQIRLHHNYQGIRCQFESLLIRTRIAIQIDVGFNDAVVPAPVRVDYPTLLDFPPPSIWVYSAETVVAEKFEAMVMLAEANSRMKDFYDIWLLSTQRQFDAQTLSEALKATFERRGTALPTSPPHALSPAFHDLPIKQTQWRAFLRKILRQDIALSLGDVTREIGSFLMPLVEGLQTGKLKAGTWIPDQGWTEELR